MTGTGSWIRTALASLVELLIFLACRARLKAQLGAITLGKSIFGSVNSVHQDAGQVQFALKPHF
jgi:hypothetical protein